MVRAPSSRLGALALAMLLPSLGTSIANVALPTIATAFVAPMADVQWVVIAYLLAVTTLIVGAGRLGDLFGRRRLLLAGIGVFVVASMGCAIAPSLWALIAARGLQGLGAAIMMALTVASVTDAVPADQTGSAMGLLGTVSAVGTALGPSLGGALVAWFGWPAVFVLMAGIAAVTFLVGWLTLPSDGSRERGPISFDVPGMLLLAGSLGAFAIAATASGSIAQFGVPIAVLAALGFLVLVIVERRSPSPLIHLELLREGKMRAGLVSMGLVSAIMMATLVVGPFYLSRVLGLGPVHTGLAMSVGPGVAALTGLPAGRLVDQLGAFKLSVGGLIGIAFGSALMIFAPSLFGVAGYIGALAVVTSGYSLFQAANTTDVMKRSTKDRRGVTSALLGLFRNLGLIAGASVMGTVFTLSSQVRAFGVTGGEAGMRSTFAVAAAIAGLALVIVVWSRLSRVSTQSPIS